MSNMEITVVLLWLLILTASILAVNFRIDQIDKIRSNRVTENNVVVSRLLHRVSDLEKGEAERNLKMVSNKDLKLIRRDITDLKIGKVKPKFKELDKVKHKLTLTLDGHNYTYIDQYGTYVSRYIDYEKECWMCYVVEGEDLIKVREVDLSLDKK